MTRTVENLVPDLSTWTQGSNLNATAGFTMSDGTPAYKCTPAWGSSDNWLKIGLVPTQTRSGTAWYFGVKLQAVGEYCKQLRLTMRYSSGSGVNLFKDVFIWPTARTYWLGPWPGGPSAAGIRLDVQDNGADLPTSYLIGTNPMLYNVSTGRTKYADVTQTYADGAVTKTTALQKRRLAVWGDSLVVNTGGDNHLCWKQLAQMLGIPAATFGTYNSIDFPGAGEKGDGNIYRGGVSSDSSSDILTRFQAADDSLKRRLTIFWEWGGKNVANYSSFLSDVAAIKEELRTLGNPYWLIGSIIPADHLLEETGGATRAKQDAINASLKAAYPNNYVDLLPYLQLMTDGGTEDTNDIASDLVPGSVRTTFAAIANITNTGGTTYRVDMGAGNTHGQEDGDTATIFNSTPSTYDGDYTVTYVDTRYFDITIEGTPGAWTSSDLRDQIHLSKRGYAAVAHAFADKYEANGWDRDSRVDELVRKPRVFF